MSFLGQLGSLVVSIEANMASFQSDLGRASRMAEESMHKIEAGAEMAKRALEALGVGFGAAEIKEFIGSTVEAEESMYNMAQKTGVAVEKLSAYELLAKQSGTNLEGMTTGFKKLAVAMSDHPEYLAKIGVATKDAHGNMRSLDSVLIDVAEKFSGYTDGAAKVDLGTKLFGKGVMDLLPMLNEGAEGFEKAKAQAEKYGLVLGTDAAKAAHEFDDKLKLLSSSSSALGRSILADLLPPLNTLVDALLKLKAKEGGDEKVSVPWLENFVRASAIQLTKLEILFEEAAEKVTFGKLSEGHRKAAEAAIATLQRLQSEQASAMAVKPYDYLTPYLKDDKPKHEAPKVGDATSTSDGYDQLLAKIKQYDAQLMQEVQIGRTLTEGERMAIEIKQKLTVAQQGAIKATMDKTLADEASWRQTEEVKKQAQEMEKVSKNEIEALDKLITEQRLHNAEIGKTAEQKELAKAAIEAEKTTQMRAYADAIRAAADYADADKAIYIDRANALDIEIAKRQEIAGLLADAAVLEKNAAIARKSAEEWKTMWSSVESTGKTVFTNLFSGGKNAFEGIGKAIQASVIDVMYQLTMKKWLIQIEADMQASAGNQSVGGFSSLFSGLFGGSSDIISPGWDAGPPIPSYAVGTDYVPYDMVAQIHKGEKIIPASQNNGNGITVNVINNASQTVTATPQQNSSGGFDLIIEHVENKIAGNIARGSGALNNAMTSAFGLNRAAGAY